MENTSSQTTVVREDPPFSIIRELKSLGATAVDILSRYWRLLILAALIGGLGGGIYRWLKPVLYTARMTFVVEESKIGGGSLASALAGQIGVDIGALGGSSGGVLAGDNVQALVKSHKLIRQTLLTSYDSNKVALTLADKYAESRRWKRKWEKEVGPVQFGADRPLTRTEDSLLQLITDEIVTSDLNVAKPDKKLSFFEMSTSMRDEKLSLLFCQRLLKATVDFYIDTKTKRLATNVRRLQAKADSLARALNYKTYAAADANRQLLDANPAFSAPEVSAEISSRDKFMQATIYAKIIENLEISKTALIQETPTIQAVDEPEIPLKDNHLKLWKAVLMGSLLAVTVTLIYLGAFHRKRLGTF